MMGKKDYSERSQMEIVSLEELVPKNHLVRKIEDAMDFSFIYDEVKELYSDFGRESIDPVVLVKIAMLQYIFGIPSMRQAIREIEVNIAYRWFLGYGMYESILTFLLTERTIPDVLKELDYSRKYLSAYLRKSTPADF